MMTSNVSEPAVVCGQMAHKCICDREPNHDEPHLCKCEGSWVGTYEADDFDVVAWPAAVGS